MSTLALRRSARKALIGAAALLVMALPLLYPAITVPLTPREQAEGGLVLLGIAMLASLVRSLRPLIMFLSAFASARYFYWRVTSTLSLDRPADAVVSLSLLAAETYGLTILFLGYFQTVELRSHDIAPIHRVPTVDVFVPTYNEPVDILRRTLIGALAIDYPKKTVHVLDDGRRPEVQALAESLGCSYLPRTDNSHAKAGNLNHALTRTDGELIAIFDADHVPVQGFLRKTVGFFEDPRLALVQTAQHFFNPDPYERNLKLTGRIAPEQSFFYHVVQPGNDFWNSAFFCGSSAVLRRSALASIGGFKTSTVTEDAHTAVELHSRGYASAYLALPLAAGLATETFSAHVQQRIRWARGMAQILRLDCPLFKKGLKLSQRLNYTNAMLHFFFGLPRLILVVAPLTFLLFGVHPIQADALALLAYILPHVGLSTVANSMLSDRYRHSFWASVYEVSIAPYTAAVTLLALFNPRLGKFNVTAKGTSLETARFDVWTGIGTLVLLGLSVAGLMVAFPLRLVLVEAAGGDPAQIHCILVNAAWALANTITLVAAACVAYEQPQQRECHRIPRDYSCEVRFDGDTLDARTVDISENGARLIFPSPRALPDTCRILIRGDQGTAVTVSARLRFSDWGDAHRMEAGFQFVDVDPATHQDLIRLIFSSDGGWTQRAYPRDDPLRSFAYLLTTFWRVTTPRRPESRRAPGSRVAGPAGSKGSPVAASLWARRARTFISTLPFRTPARLPWSRWNWARDKSGSCVAWPSGGRGRSSWR